MNRLATLMAEYLKENGRDGQAGEFFGSGTQLNRALVHKGHIPTHSTITASEDARQIILDADFTVVTHCYCRHKKVHQGKACRKGAPAEETCMVLGEGARFLVWRGFAYEKSTEEMLGILEHARSLLPTHVTDNTRDKLSFVCNCCRCCGACIPVCEKSAISLVSRKHHRRPPKNEGRMFARILWKKGRLSPYVRERIRRAKARPALIRRTARRPPQRLRYFSPLFQRDQDW